MKNVILFDIDGTLISSSGTGDRKNNRFSPILNEVFSIDSIYDRKGFNGWTDFAIITHMVKSFGISESEVRKKLPLISDKMIQRLQEVRKEKELYPLLPGVKELLNSLNEEYEKGVFTGNLNKIAAWKLSNAGIESYFSFGLFGDEAFSKRELIKSFNPKGKKVIVIGDTNEDILSAKQNGYYSVMVSTSPFTSDEEIINSGADLVVPDFTDPKLLKMLL